MNQRMDYYNRTLQKKTIYNEIAKIIEIEDEASLLYVTVPAPVLMEYVTWVLTEAQRSGKERLYFLARDGYQMYLTAKELCRICHIPIECRYLQVSRYAMRVPEYHLLGEKCLDYICIGGIDVTLERIMKRAGLTDAEASEITCDMGDVQKILNYQEIMKLKEELRCKPKFFTYVYKHSKEAYDTAIGYLRQEGLFDAVSYALVDSGWVGTLQKTIAHLVDNEVLEGYYFGVYETPKGIDASRYHAFYFGSKWGLKRKVTFSNCLFEAIFTSPDGMTVGYEKKGDIYAPVSDFHRNPNAKLVEKNCRVLQRYLNCYEAVVCECGKDNEPQAKWVESLFKKFMGNPTETELSAYGNVLFSDDVLEGNLKKVAAELSEEEIRKQHFINKALIMLGLRKGEIHESAWIEGSIAKLGRNVKKNLWHARIYKYFVYIRKMLK